MMTSSSQFAGDQLGFRASPVAQCQGMKHRFFPWVGKVPWRRKWPPAPVFLPGKSHGQRSLAGYYPQDHRRVQHNLATK